MAVPRFPFLYPNLMRAVRSCEPTTHLSIRIPPKTSSTSRRAFHTTRRREQGTYHRRYGPAAEANLPPPHRPKGEASDQPAANPPPSEKDSSSDQQDTAPPEQPQPQESPEKDTIEKSPSAAEDLVTTRSAKHDTPAEPEPKEEPAPAQAKPDAEEASPSERVNEERNAPPPPPPPPPQDQAPLDSVFHMPSPSAFLTPSGSPGSDNRPPHMAPAPYVHHFDTYSLVRDLSKGAFTDDQSVTIMKAVRRILQNNLDFAKQSLTSKSDEENESYLFKAACSELQSSLQTARNAEIQRQRASRTQLQHESDILSQRLNQELAGLKDDIKGMFNDHKMTTREQQRSIDTSVQELNYKITVSLNSDGKSEIEGLRWILTRRAAMAVAISACRTCLCFNLLEF
ncbi:hypothetical protein AWENTII_000419 [Aspergillus wentii]